MEEADPEIAEAAEADEADGTRGLVVRAVVSPEAPDTLMGPQIKPARSIGNLGRGRGYVPTDITVPGGITRAPALDIIETLPVLKSKKYKIEKLTSQKLF